MFTDQLLEVKLVPQTFENLSQFSNLSMAFSKPIFWQKYYINKICNDNLGPQMARS